MNSAPRRRFARIPFNANELGLMAAIVVVAALITVLDSQHNYWQDPAGSLKEILWHASMLGIFSLGAALVIISGGIDLSSGSMIAFSAAVCASIIFLLAPEAADNVYREYGGVGIHVTESNGQLVVVKPLPEIPLYQVDPTPPDTPAQKAGVLAGDRIVAIDGQSTDTIAPEEAARRLQGEEDTSVTLTVIHPGKTSPQIISITREAIRVMWPVGWGVIGLAILGTLLVAVLVGSMHAWLITVIGLPPFIATLASLVGLRSFARWLVKRVTYHVSETQLGMGSESSQINVFDDSFHGVANTYHGPLILFVLLVVFCAVLLNRTAVGRHLYALGGNEEAAKLSGIRTDRIKWLAYCLSAVFSSIAGILYLSYLSLVKPSTLAMGYELNGIAAAVVGGCSLQGGVGTVLGTVLGCVFLRTVIDGIAKVIKADANTYEGLIVGIVVVVAVAFNQLRQTAGVRVRFFGGALGTVMVLTLALLAGVVGGLIAGKAAATVAGFSALALLGTIKLLEARVVIK